MGLLLVHGLLVVSRPIVRVGTHLELNVTVKHSTFAVKLLLTNSENMRFRVVVPVDRNRSKNTVAGLQPYRRPCSSCLFAHQVFMVRLRPVSLSCASSFVKGMRSTVDQVPSDCCNNIQSLESKVFQFGRSPWSLNDSTDVASGRDRSPPVGIIVKFVFQ